jgi:hypothetical protein
MESKNRGLGPSGWCPKGGLAIYNRSEPNWLLAELILYHGRLFGMLVSAPQIFCGGKGLFVINEISRSPLTTRL